MCPFAELGALGQRTIAGRDQEADSQVDPDALPGRRERFGRDVDALDAHPVPPSFSADGDGLGGPFDRPVQTHLDVADSVDAESPGVLIDCPALGVVPLERDKRARSLEPWEPRLLSGLASPEEPLEGLIQPKQRSPADRHPKAQDVGADRAKLGQLLGLVEVGDRTRVPLPGPSAFFESGVVELSLESEQALDRGQLPARRLKHELVGPAAGHRPKVWPGCNAEWVSS